MRNINKLASLLDRAGDYNLADKLDKIAQDLSPGNNVASMDYKTDIEEYKRLLQSGNLQAANILKDNVISRYDEKSKIAFLYQALKIEAQLNYKYKKEDSYTNDQLYSLLNNYGINNAQDLKTFNSSWNKMMSDLKNKNLLTNNKRSILLQTYWNIAAKYAEIDSNMTGNFNHDLDLYKALISKRLFTEASSLLSQVLSSDKYSYQQKEIFKLRADSWLNAQKNQSNESLLLGGVNHQYLSDKAKYFGVYNAKNINQFNNAWNKLINFLKKQKMNTTPQSPTIYNYPGAAYEVENFRKELMIQLGFTTINPSK